MNKEYILEKLRENREYFEKYEVKRIGVLVHMQKMKQQKKVILTSL